MWSESTAEYVGTVTLFCLTQGDMACKEAWL